MKLFKSLRESHEIDLNALVFSTPLGNIYFDFLFNGKEISNVKPLKTEIIDQTIISSWDLDECYIEFLKGNFIPKIPFTMKVEACIAGIWRIKSLSKKLKPNFKVHLDTELISEFEENPEGGEGLISQNFENTNYKLSVGTEDEDFLIQRAIGRKWMPLRFQNLINPNMIEYIPGGLQIELPLLENGECVQIQFVVAWSKKNYPEVSTWFAVEQSPNYILQSLSII